MGKFFQLIDTSKKQKGDSSVLNFSFHTSINQGIPVKPDDATDDRFEFVAGQVHGLIAGFLALIETHPTPDLLLQQLHKVHRAAEGRAIPTTISDDFLMGIDDVMLRLQDMATRSAQKKQNLL
tara:strand:- start:433828 stop:434196 length:369 start_codon:yes stop_codon:yes gene_type:complete